MDYHATLMPCSLWEVILLSQAILSSDSYSLTKDGRIWPPSTSSDLSCSWCPLLASFRHAKAPTHHRPFATAIPFAWMPLPSFVPYKDSSFQGAYVIAKRTAKCGTCYEGKRAMWSKAVKMTVGGDFQQGANVIQWRKDGLFKKRCWNNWTSICKKKTNLNLYLELHIKIN